MSEMILNKIYFKFFHSYYLNKNTTKENIPTFQIAGREKLSPIFYAYTILFTLGVILTGFAVDIRFFYLNIFVMVYFVVTNIVAVIYAFSFFKKSKESITTKRWYFYPYILLFILPLIFFIVNGEPYKFSAYYTFYLFFLMVYLKVLPDVNYFLKNLHTMWIVLKSIFTFIGKMIFIKMDKRGFANEINKLKISKKLSKKYVTKRLLYNQKVFKVIFIIISFFTIVDLFFGISLNSLYSSYILPILENLNQYIDGLEGVNNGLYILVNIFSAITIICAYLVIIFMVYYAYNCYLKVLFLDELLTRLEKKQSI